MRQERQALKVALGATGPAAKAWGLVAAPVHRDRPGKESGNAIDVPAYVETQISAAT
jgi:hypothetical protein